MGIEGGDPEPAHQILLPLGLAQEVLPGLRRVQPSQDCGHRLGCRLPISWEPQRKSLWSWRAGGWRKEGKIRWIRLGVLPDTRHQNTWDPTQRHMRPEDRYRVLPIKRFNRTFQGVQARVRRMLNVREILPSPLENSRPGSDVRAT